MKKAAFLFGFVSLLVLSLAFVPTETVAEDAAFFGSGKFAGCAIQPAAPIATYQLIPQGGGTTITGSMDCDPSWITLTPGVEYELFVTSTTQAWVSFQWEFCNTPGSVPGTTVFAGTTYITSILIPC